VRQLLKPEAAIIIKFHYLEECSQELPFIPGATVLENDRHSYHE